MALCLECPIKIKQECKSICDDVKKEITGRGKTASRKPKTYLVDFSYIQDPHQALNPFQRDVLSAIADLSLNIKKRLDEKLTIKEVMDDCLSDKENQIVQFLVEGYTQDEVGKKLLGISQQRVNQLIKKIRAKLRNFLLGTC